MRIIKSIAALSIMISATCFGIAIHQATGQQTAAPTFEYLSENVQVISDRYYDVPLPGEIKKPVLENAVHTVEQVGAFIYLSNSSGVIDTFLVYEQLEPVYDDSETQVKTVVIDLATGRLGTITWYWWYGQCTAANIYTERMSRMFLKKI